MLMLASGLLAGFIVGIASGGAWRNLGRLELKFWPALLVGAIARLIAPFLAGLALTTSIAGLVLVAFVAIVNRALPGAWLIGFGSVLNTAVILANGGMPIDPGALATSGKATPADGLHVILGPDSRLSFLADVLLIPVLNNIYSVGDVLLAIGGFWTVFRLVKSR
ncbi:MAG: DUF5317 domain-containing protein [Chloroflexota bacterium]|nr:DUF5317 domain-containing protein [Chloroflexota bacterium]